jgi:SH3-like domain-containing protein
MRTGGAAEMALLMAFEQFGGPSKVCQSFEQWARVMLVAYGASDKKGQCFARRARHGSVRTMARLVVANRGEAHALSIET